MLKNILAEYPDGGQILKELIQNAEDAGAREVKLLYDGRRLNDQTDETSPEFTKFFKAPALCVYNDAVFSERDWEGIKKIYSSVKENEKLKVGKFGLGFKSVFHMTDYPCVVSADKMLLVNPHRHPEMVNADFDIGDINDSEEDGLIAHDVWRFLDNTFGFQRATVDGKYYQGTFFWFPLRESKSQLSGTLYNEQKVNDLFESFQLEADNILIFMKNLEKISLYRRSNREISNVMTVEVQNAVEKVRPIRDDFNEKVRENDSFTNELKCILPMTISIRSTDRTETVDWFVVNYIINTTSCSYEFKKLIEDTNASKYPYVGVAVPLHKQIHGHVYCFLPLPQEGETLTGLPVHINGFFELNQSRHNLKWDTDEHSGKPTDDRSILWNKGLIEEALPKAYEYLVIKAIENIPGHPQNDDLNGLYNMLPSRQSSSHAQKRWSILINKLYQLLKSHKLLYSPTTQMWVQVKDACFATFRDINGNNKSGKTKSAIVNCLKSLNKMYVDIPTKLFDTLKEHFEFIRELNAETLTSYMRQGNGYKSLCDDDKLAILDYLLSSLPNVSYLDGLELLPLDDNSWCEISQRGKKKALCANDEEVGMFPGLGDKLVLRQSKLGPQLYTKLKNMCCQGTSQMVPLSNELIKSMLNEILNRCIGNKGRPVLSHTKPLNITWLHTVWNVLQRTGKLIYCKDVPLIPLLQQGTWTQFPVVELYKPEGLFLKTDCPNSVLSQDLQKCFETLMVTIIPSLPDWINTNSLEKCIYLATNEGLVSLLRSICQQQQSYRNAVISFNGLPHTIMTSMKQFCRNNYVRFDTSTLNVLKQLSLFEGFNATSGPGFRTSVYQTSLFMLDRNMDMLPNVQFPKAMIRAKKDDVPFFNCIGAQEVNLSAFVNDVLRYFQRVSFTNPSSSNSITMIEFMWFVIDHFYDIGNSKDTIVMAKTLPFLVADNKLHKPLELFDPLDEDLRSLFRNQNLFPERQHGFTKQQVHVLSDLGLKSAKHIEENIIYESAQKCHQMSNDLTNIKNLQQKSSTLVVYLSKNSNLLTRQCRNGQYLWQNLMHLKWVPVANRPPDYPSNLPWFSQDKIVSSPSTSLSVSSAILVGAVKDIVLCDSDKLCQQFKWSNSPCIQDAIKQLEILDQHFERHLKAEFLHVIQKIYNFLNEQNSSLIKQIAPSIKGKKIIWTGCGFQIPNNVIVNCQSEDVDLKPIYYTIPEEFVHMRNLFLSLGCIPEQDNNLLSQTLRNIKNQGVLQADCFTVRELVLNVLRKLSENLKGNSSEIQQLDIQMMVESDQEVIDLQPISKCILDENDDENMEEDSDMLLVHETIPRKVAIDLGIKSAKSKTLTEAINTFQPWGQTEPLTKRIETLLKREYTFGLGVPKELVQNADDAGASIVKFMFDERINDDAKDKLFSPTLAECQDSALWVFNDESFTKDDLENIRLLNGGTKADNAEKIGQFGLGFCAVYNLTELPSFISGENLVIFDPHEKYLSSLCEKSSPGLKVNLTSRRKRRLVKDHFDQFKPYQNVFGCNPVAEDFSGYKGTLFRFPLRTPQQAETSKLCQTPCTRDNMMQLLSTIVDNAGNFLLFTQHVSCIQIYHIPRGETDPSNASLIFEVKKNSEDTGCSTNTNVQSVLSRMLKKNNQDFSEIHNLTIKQQLFSRSRSVIPIEPYQIESTWTVSWVSRKSEIPYNVQVKLSKKHLPISAVALPVRKDTTGKIQICPLGDVGQGFYSTGSLFCFLPLPIRTKLPFHLNGCFEVSSDRKRLVQITDDEIGKQFHWNSHIMKTSVVASFIQLLEYLKNCSEADYQYHSMWPVNDCSVADEFRKGFFSAVYNNEAELFQSMYGWHSFDRIVFFPPKLRRRHVIGDAAFNMYNHFCSQSTRKIVEMPEDLYNALKEFVDTGNSTRFTNAVVSESDVVNMFLDNIHGTYWSDKLESRKSLTLFALEMTCQHIEDRLKSTACIPSSCNGVLRKPSDLIDPNAEIAKMFNDSEGKFPQHGEFRSYDVLTKLIKLGMVDKALPKDLLLDRCKSVSLLGRTCHICSRDQCGRVLKYLVKHITEVEMKDDLEFMNELKQTSIMPVQFRPKGWTFSWAADSLQSVDAKPCSKHVSSSNIQFLVDKPVNLYSRDNEYCIGSLKLIIDEMFLRSSCGYFSLKEITQLLEIKTIASPELLKKQLLTLSEEYKMPNQQASLTLSCQRIYEKLTQFIDYEKCRSDAESHIHNLFSDIQDRRIILVGQNLVAPECVAFNVKAEYIPFLCRCTEIQDKVKRLFSLFGVCDFFSIKKIVSVLKNVRDNWNNDRCIDVVANLLQNLCESMSKEEKQYSDLQDFKEFIVAPDENERLHPTENLVIDDRLFLSKKQMYFLHGKIQPEIARKVGVKSKKKHVVDGFSKLIPFGQKENLATRLKGLLEDYPCDASIMKELLQNADDANATELHFIKDFQKDGLPDQSFGQGAFQPPALCVFNNGYFTEEDFKGIQNLGEGSKKTDPTKTGQYGVGFNTVYHLTDSPSFFTKGPGLGPKGTLCIFDPLLKVIHEYVSKEEPGIRCDVDEMTESFPDISKYYFADQSLFAREEGTLFRLPLRTEASAISGDIMTEKKIENFIEEMKADLFEMLLFLKNVRKIKVSHVDDSGKIIEEYCVESVMSSADNEKRNSFFSKIITKKELPQMQDIVDYQMTIKDSCGKRADWFVAQCYGFTITDDINSKLREIRDFDICQLPLGAVAMPMITNELSKRIAEIKQSNVAKERRYQAIKEHISTEIKTMKSFIGKAFCLLPLKGCTKLNFHYNAHFVLDRARTGIYMDGLKGVWNKLLLDEIVTKAWVHGMKFLQEKIGSDIRFAPNWNAVYAFLEMYGSFFPKEKHHFSPFNKQLGENIYKTIIITRTALMPVVMHRKEHLLRQKTLNSSTKSPLLQNQKFWLEWVGLANEQYPFSGIFKNITLKPSYAWPGQYNDPSFNIGHAIENILKLVGMKLIESPSFLYHCITSYDLEAVQTNSAVVSKFLSSFVASREDGCYFGNTNIPVEQTLFQSVQNVILLMKYILQGYESVYLQTEKEAKALIDTLKGLPLCISADNVVSTFDVNNPLYWSKLSELLPKSLSCFLHEHLIDTLHGQLKCLETSGLIKRFTIPDLVQLLPESYSSDILRNSANVRWFKKEGNPVSEKFLQLLFQFIISESQKLTSIGTNFTDSKCLKENLNFLKDWSFIPARHVSSDTQIVELVPISKGEHVLYIHTTVNQNIADIMKQMQIPLLDDSALKYDNVLYDTLVASLRDACKFLKLLHYYKIRIVSSNISVAYGRSLMKFFEQHVRDLDEGQVLHLMKDLSLFETSNGELKSISSFSKVVVLPENLPNDGLQTWSNNTNILLLKQYAEVRRIYEKLELHFIKPVEFYCQLLLPKVSSLPEECLIRQIKYIRDAVLPLLDTTSNERAQIIQMLSDMPFINKCGRMLKVNELFDRHNVVYNAMIDEECFLDDVFYDEKWMSFLKHLGLNVEVTPRQLITFASQIANDGVYNVSESICSQSEILLKFFVDKSKMTVYDKSILNQLKNIKFILPYKVEEILSSIHPQIDHGNRLVSFNNSVPLFYKNVCWTSVPILPYPKYRGEISPDMCRILGIDKGPTASNVILHCQNICDSIQAMSSERSSYILDDIRPIFEKIYKYLSEHLAEIGDAERQRLQHTCLILMSRETANRIVLVKTEDVVIELLSSDEIRPYLWRIPKEFSLYRNVFERLGSSQNVKCSHYISVLKMIRQKFPEQLPPSEMERVAKCIKGIEKLIRNEESQDLSRSSETLYLPNRDRRLVCSSDLIVSDNESFERRIEHHCRFVYFIGFKELDIALNQYEFFDKLPEHMKPQKLTQQLEEVVSADQLEVVDSNFASILESFLHCSDFIEGVIRLIKHHLNQEGSQFSSTPVSEIISNFENVKVQKVSGLFTSIKYQGNIVPSSEKDKTCFIQRSNENGTNVFKLYFQVNEETHDVLSKLTDANDGVIDLIDKCTNDLSISLHKYLCSILKEIGDPSNISCLLDEKNIAAYDLPMNALTSAFPPPGTYVPQYFFPFLDRSMEPFLEHEFRYVAYDIGEFNEALDVYDEVYIYAHIMKQVDVGTFDIMYKINVGSDTFPTVPLHRLFRFVPQHEETGSDVVVYDSEPVGAVPFDENCKRIRQILTKAWASNGEAEKRRVINRLKLKWHPDKNTNKDYASRVYNYLNHVILQLEKNGIVGEELNDTPSDMSSSSYGSMSANTHNRGCRYAQAWYSNVNNYRRSRGAGRFSHRHLSSTPIPDLGNAKRWQRQATKDYQMAQSSLESAKSVSGYNWICYKCHQACEKSLKAAGFAKDANTVQRNSHSLSSLASTHCNSSLNLLVQDLEQCVGDYFGLRYPDVHSAPNIPSNMVTEAQANKALETTKEILDIVSEMID